MKKRFTKKSLWQSLFSLSAAGIFILLATGSLDEKSIRESQYLGVGIYETTEYYGDGVSEITTGKRDENGRWHGSIKIESRDEAAVNVTVEKEEVNMVNGKRHGKSKITLYDGYSGSEVYTSYKCYNMGVAVDCEETARKSIAEISSFQNLSNKYPWFLYKLNGFGFEDEYVEAYMDTVETVMATFDFELIEFDDTYDEVLEILEETPYDSIIALNSRMTFFQGLEELKNSEFRQAVIDRYRTDGNSTYPILENTYPGYLSAMNEVGVNDQDFEGFCQDVDSIMTSYGILDLEDPFFLDSVDTRIYRALTIISEFGNSSSEALKSIKSARVSEISFIINKPVIDSTSVEVAGMVFYFMVLKIAKGDILREAVREAYIDNQGIIRVPTATTIFSGGNSATSAILNGYVLEDGGADVTSRGIAWASYYNPTVFDHSEASGTGIGDFSVTLDGLTEGDTYYARTYANNSAGTAYGNCIRFISQSTVGVEENVPFARNFTIYPIPASTSATISFQMESSANMGVTIIDLKGQVVIHHDIGSMPPGENQVKLDLSGLQSGIYNCQLTNNGTIEATRKLVIVH